MKAWARSFQSDTARSTVCSCAFSETSQPASNVSAPRLSEPRSTPRRSIASMSLRLSRRKLWSMPCLGRNSERERRRMAMAASFSMGRFELGGCGLVAVDGRAACEHGDERMRHQQRQRHMHDQEPDDGGHAEEVHEARGLEGAEQRQQLRELHRLQIASPERAMRMPTAKIGRA